MAARWPVERKLWKHRDLTIDDYVIITDLGIEKVPGPAFAEQDLETVVHAVKRQNI